MPAHPAVEPQVSLRRDVRQSCEEPLTPIQTLRLVMAAARAGTLSRSTEQAFQEGFVGQAAGTYLADLFLRQVDSTAFKDIVA